MTKNKETLYVFDFDGTVTRRDTLLAFISYVNGPARLWLSLLLMLPRLLLMKLGLCDNGRTKERLFARHFGGMTLSDFTARGKAFACRRHLLRGKAVEAMRAARQTGARVFVVSASVAEWVEPFFGGQATVLGTQPEVKDGRLTGRFSSPNCYGQEKVNRLKAAVEGLESHRNDYYIIAFGDSRGDKEMLEFADEPHYKPFRP